MTAWPTFNDDPAGADATRPQNSWPRVQLSLLPSSSSDCRRVIPFVKVKCQNVQGRTLKRRVQSSGKKHKDTQESIPSR